jgi:sugar phosphate isomerase/epimerase
MKLSRLTRREMLVNSAGLATARLMLRAGRLDALSLGSSHAAAHALGFKIGTCDWTLGKRADPSALEMAKQLGLDGVQVDLGHQDNDLPLRTPELQKKYLEMEKIQGVEMASLAIVALNEVPYKSDPRAEQWVADSIDVSKALGTHIVLVPFFGRGDLRGDKEGTDVVVRHLRWVAPKAEKAGVILGLESWLSAEQHRDILDRVGSPAVQVYYDLGNSHKQGYDIYKEIRFLGKNICEFHAKDYNDLYGKGTINFPEVRRAMDDVGYRGWIHIEGVKMPLGLEGSVRYDEEYLRSIFPRQT